MKLFLSWISAQLNVQKKKVALVRLENAASHMLGDVRTNLGSSHFLVQLVHVPESSDFREMLPS